MATAPGFLGLSASRFNTAAWRPAGRSGGSHPMATRAPACGQPPFSARMAIPVTSCETSPPSVVALTGKQKVALMLAKAGYSHAFIAEKLGLKHRVTATKLIHRARAAEKAFKAAVADFISCS